MLNNMLLRDVRLYGGALVLPILCALILGLAFSVPGTPDGVIGVPLFLGATVPLNFHWREMRNHTLGDLLTLPISRGSLIYLRYLEGIVGGLLCVCLALITCHIAGGEMRFQELNSLNFLWVFFFSISYPLPFLFKWDLMGLVTAAALLWLIFLSGALNTIFAQYAARGPQDVPIQALRAGIRAALGPDYASWGEGSLLILLFLVFHRTSNKIFSTRDF